MRLVQEAYLSIEVNSCKLRILWTPWEEHREIYQGKSTQVIERARTTMVQIVCGECMSTECSVINWSLLSACVMRVSEAFSMQFLVNQGNLIDTSLSFSEKYVSIKVMPWYMF